MATIKVSEMRYGQDAQGRYVQAQDSAGEWCGVSLLGEDEVVRDMSDLRPGQRIEVGSDDDYEIAAE